MFTRPFVLSIKAILAVFYCPVFETATMSDVTLACRMCTQPFSDVRLPKLVSKKITHIAFEYQMSANLLAARGGWRGTPRTPQNVFCVHFH
jgi:hypothetical protein